MTLKPTYGQYVVPSAETMVNFGVGQPCNDELPLSIIKKACKKISKINDYSLLQYGDIPGYSAFRNCLSEFLTKRYQTDVSADDLFVTNGVTGAVSLIASLLKKSNAIPYGITKVYVEEPTYFLMINIFKELGLEIETISIQNDGINIDELKNKLDNDSNSSHLLYTIPTFHNPTSITMSHEKRKEIAKLAEEYNMFILADEVYQLLYFDDKDKPPLPMYYYSNMAFSVSSFSKILAPALRLGWIQACPELLDVLKKSGQLDSSGGINPFISRIVHNVIENGDMDLYLDKTRETLGKRCDVLCDSLGNNLQYSKPLGGYFIWIELPFDSHGFSFNSSRYKVKFHTGNKFSAKPNGMINNIRLSFSFYDYDGLKLGAKRLLESYHEWNQLMKITNVSLHGHTGRLGSKIKEHIDKSDHLQLFSTIGRDHNFVFVGINDVIVDVSNAKGTEELLTSLITKGISNVPILIGTTGQLPYNLIKQYALSAPVAVISNFSYGVPFLLSILKQFKSNSVNNNNWKISIEETHHVHKLDKPSGTAKSLAKSLDYRGDITSIREGEVFGEHVVKIENENEAIEFKHSAKTRDIFASGCLRFIEWIKDQPNGLYFSMSDDPKHINQYEKWDGCGNTFGITELKYCANNPELITQVCNELNVDGLINYELLNTGKHDFIWTYYNRDGSCVEMCGNGARCVAKCVSNKLGKNKLLFKNNFNIEMIAEISDNLVKVLMPYWSDHHYCSTNTETKFFIKVGVPHLVYQVWEDEINNDTLEDCYVKGNEYTKRVIGTNTNVSISWETEDEELDETIKHVRTYEKGVERETGACGTACCAVCWDNLSSSFSQICQTSSGARMTVIHDFEKKELWLESEVNKI